MQVPVTFEAMAEIPDPVPGPRGYGVGLSVLDYGATGDGAINDGPSINQTIAACAALGGGDVWVPGEGRNYVIGNGGVGGLAQGITLQTNVRLVCGPGHRLIRNYSGNDSGNATIRNGDQVNGNQNIGVIGAVIKTASPAMHGRHFGFVEYDNLTVVGTVVEDCYGDWISRFIGNGTIISQNRWSSPDTAEFADGIHISGGSGHVVSDNILNTQDDCIAIGAEGDAQSRDVSDVTIRNNVCNPGHAHALRIWATGAHTHGIKRVVVSGMVGKHRGSVSPSRSIFVSDVRTTAQAASGRIEDVSISGVEIDAALGFNDAVVLQGIPGNVVSGAVAFKRLRNIRLSDMTIKNAHRRYLNISGADDVTVRDFLGDGMRDASGGGYSGIHAHACQRVGLFNVRSYNATLSGIDFGNTPYEAVKDSIIAGCHAEEFVTRGIHLNGCDGVRVVGNRALGGNFGYYQQSCTNSLVGSDNDWRGNTTPSQVQ